MIAYTPWISTVLQFEKVQTEQSRLNHFVCASERAFHSLLYAPTEMFYNYEPRMLLCEAYYRT